MEHREYTQSYSAFASLVNLHLEARHHAATKPQEVLIIQKWHDAASMDKSAHLQCVQEIIHQRENQ